MKRLLLAGFTGGIALLCWTFIANTFLGVSGRTDRKPLPDERAVYALLQDAIVEPGGYIANPEFDPEGAFPGDEPVYSIHFSGIGHGEAGRLMAFELFLAFAGALIAAWLLSCASQRIRSRYLLRVLFVCGLGALLALFGDLTRLGIGGYPVDAALLLASHRMLSWILAGVVMAAVIRRPRSDLAIGYESPGTETGRVPFSN